MLAQPGLSLGASVEDAVEGPPEAGRVVENDEVGGLVGADIIGDVRGGEDEAPGEHDPPVAAARAPASCGVIEADPADGAAEPVGMGADHRGEEGAGGLLDLQQQEARGALGGTSGPEAVLVLAAAAAAGLVAQGDGASEDLDGGAGDDGDRLGQARQADGGPSGVASGEFEDGLRPGARGDAELGDALGGADPQREASAPGGGPCDDAWGQGEHVHRGRRWRREQPAARGRRQGIWRA